jgi:hypothetical protein
MLLQAWLAGCNRGCTVSPHTGDRLIPLGLPPEVHLMLGCAFVCPLLRPVVLADDLDFAVCTVAEQGDQIRAWRLWRWRILSKHLMLYSSGPAKLSRSSSSLRVSSHLDPMAIEALRYSIQCPDASLASTTMTGVLIIGERPTFGVFRHAEVKALCSAEKLLDDSPDWLRELLGAPPAEFGGAACHLGEDRAGARAGQPRGVLRPSGAGCEIWRSALADGRSFDQDRSRDGIRPYFIILVTTFVTHKVRHSTAQATRSSSERPGTCRGRTARSPSWTPTCASASSCSGTCPPTGGSSLSSMDLRSGFPPWSCRSTASPELSWPWFDDCVAGHAPLLDAVEAFAIDGVLYLAFANYRYGCVTLFRGVWGYCHPFGLHCEVSTYGFS